MRKQGATDEDDDGSDDETHPWDPTVPTVLRARESLHAWCVHGVTVQVEVNGLGSSVTTLRSGERTGEAELRERKKDSDDGCLVSVNCPSEECLDMQCCS